MRSHLQRWLLPWGLATATLLGTAASASADPQVRDHRGPKRYDGPPRDAPPARRAEQHDARRAGFVWVEGDWDWRDGQWSWRAGHWERERAGKKWRGRRWERRGDVYVVIDGDWIDDRPRAAPPPIRVENVRPRPGMVFVRGFYQWQNGQYVWVDGHWERERSGKRWREARWQSGPGGEWVFVAGDWEDAPVCPEHPPLDNPPPPMRAEPVRPPPPGQFIIPAIWNWNRVSCQWVWVPAKYAPIRPGYSYRPAEWYQDATNRRWLTRPAEYVQSAPPPPPPPPPPPYNGPAQPPPPPREERYEPKAGFVWARGYYEWRNGQYEWHAGHWERPRANLHWEDARWERRGNGWVFVEGGWR